MDVRNLTRTLALAGLCLCFAHLIIAEVDTSCPGPKRYYDEIGCTPLFKTPESKCPERYNCEHLKNLPTDKCYLNGHLYEIGEQLRDEDKNPCDISCTCSPKPKGPRFNCPIINCIVELQPGCYLKRNATDCCRGPQYCPEKVEDRATCVVDGIIYGDGDDFVPAAEPSKTCYCGEGYTGENVEPYCISRKITECGAMLHYIDFVLENCIPTYRNTESPKTDCFWSFRCQNDDDTVITRDAADESILVRSEPADPDMHCTFGNLTMRVGDELNRDTDVTSMCIKCLCEVPPVPTCQRISDEECGDIGQRMFNLRVRHSPWVAASLRHKYTLTPKV